MIQIWKSDTPAQRILEWVCWFCRGDQEGRAMTATARHIGWCMRCGGECYDGIRHRCPKPMPNVSEFIALKQEMQRMAAELAAERERCAKVCEAVAREYAYLGSNVAEACAVAIRKGE